MQIILAELGRPAVRGVAAWATLAGVLCDLLLAALPARARSGSLLATLSAYGRGPAAAIAVGLLHPLILGTGALAMTLAATRVEAVRHWWWAVGAGGGSVLALVVLLAGPDLGVRRCMPVVLVGIAIAAVVGMTGSTL